MSELRMFFESHPMDVASVVLVGAIVLLVYSVTQWHRSDGPFDFRKALLDPVTREISFSRLGHFVSLIISTALLCFETLQGRLTEWLFIGYMTAWAGTYVAAKAISSRGEDIKPIERRQVDTDMPQDKERRKPLQVQDDAQ